MKPLHKIAVLIILTALPAGILLVLHLVSEQRLHVANNFTRIFAPKAVLAKQVRLKNSSYYFAGNGYGRIYLGNYAEPLQLSIIDTNLNSEETSSVHLKEKDLPFRTVRITVRPPYFYVVDNTIPALFTGEVTDWKAALKWQGSLPILRHQVLDPCSLNFTRVDKNGQAVMGSASFCGESTERTKNDLLKGQTDGLFDVDGVLLYDDCTDKLAYLYHYRNQYIVTDKHLGHAYTGNTIDTNSIAKINVKHLESQSQKKLADRGLVVNSGGALYKDILFVKSALRSKFEPQDVWERATVIDTYNITNGNYLASFYINDINGEKLGSFYIDGNQLFAISGSTLLKFSLSEKITRSYNTSNEIPAVSGEGRKPVKE